MNLFSKVFRADNAVKTVTDGTGLGLYVAKTIVERHHGTLRFESTEGKGTTFFITLPNENAPFLVS
jgi:signal transduction histidine kinase